MVMTWFFVRIGSTILVGKELEELLNRAYGIFSTTNPLHADVFPSVRLMESEVISMTASILGGGTTGVNSVCGAMTGGGTESILMAVKVCCYQALVEILYCPVCFLYVQLKHLSYNFSTQSLFSPGKRKSLDFISSHAVPETRCIYCHHHHGAVFPGCKCCAYCVQERHVYCGVE